MKKSTVRRISVNSNAIRKPLLVVAGLIATVLLHSVMRIDSADLCSTAIEESQFSN